jgi:hypothetical protein
MLCAGAVLLAVIASGRPAAAQRKDAKYYFKIVEVNIDKGGDPSIADAAREILEKDLVGRPEFTADIGAATTEAAVVAELKKRGLRGFHVSLRLDKLTKDAKPPKPGGRLKQMAVDAKLSVFGTTMPGDKLSFSGDGEAALEAEVVEQRLDQDTVSMVKDVMTQAVKQAVDQAVMKLSLPQSAPMNESKRGSKKKRAPAR